jgi:hypothetical protein
MYTDEEITRCFDDTTLDYLRRKNRGGTSGGKGTTYEDYFAVYQLAYLSKDVVEGGKVIYFSSQIRAFVDDLIIDCSSEPLKHYQLKNSCKVSWSSGKNPISDDFEKQYILNQREKSRTCQLCLVVSDLTLHTKLQSCIPTKIKLFSQVFHFPYNSNILKVINLEPNFKQAIEYLSAFEHPALDKIEYVAKSLVGAWATSGKNRVAVLEVLRKAQQMTPNYVRSFRQDLQLDPEVEEILNRIEDFTYTLTKGFLHWEYAGGLQEGTPGCSIETDDFRRLQERIKERRPTSFEELENLL